MATPKILFQGGASNVLFTDRRMFYPESEVYEYWKNLTQFLTWISEISRKSTPDALYKIFEDTPTHVNQYLFNNGATVTIAANGAESADIAIDNITNLTEGATADASLVGLLFEVWDSAGTTKRGQAFISSVSSTTAVKMKTTKGTALSTVDNDVFRVIGTVRGEVSVAGEAYYNELKTAWNSTHFFSLPVEISGKLYDELQLRGVSNELGRLREKKFKEMKMQVQNGMLKSTSTVGTHLGTDSSNTFTEANLRTITDSASNTSAVRTTYGYIPILEDYGVTWNGNGSLQASTWENTNIFKLPSASLDFGTMTDMCQIIFDKRESDVIPGFCGRGFLSEINKQVVDKKFGFLGQVELEDYKINSLGFNVRNLHTPHGIIQLVPTRALDHEYNYTCLLPNDQAIGIREYKGWQYKTNIKTDNDYTGIKDVINYDAGLQMDLLPTHHMIQLTV
jgi:hypothetical protein